MALKKRKPKKFKQPPKDLFEEEKIDKLQDVDKQIPTYQNVPSGTYINEPMPIMEKKDYIDNMPRAIIIPPGSKPPLEIKSGGFLDMTKDKKYWKGIL
jgi:hypothetical protein